MYNNLNKNLDWYCIEVDLAIGSNIDSIGETHICKCFSTQLICSGMINGSFGHIFKIGFDINGLHVLNLS